MRLTQESQGRLTSSSAHAAPATAMLQGPLRRKISLELKAWEDSLAAAAGNSSFSSFNKDDDDDEENDRNNDFADESYDGSSCSTDDDDQLVVRQKKNTSSSKKSKSSKKTKKAVKIISRKNADGSIIKKEKPQQKQQQPQEQEQEQPLSPPKSVSFYPRVRIRRIKCLDDTDDETIYNMYYSPEELEDIRDGLRESIRSYIYSSSSSSSDNNTDIRSVESEDDEVDDTVVVDGFERMMVDEESDDDDSFCLRGLENEMPENKQRRRLTKSTARKAVLQEQERQRQEGYNDVYQVSFVYKRQVGSSTQAAFLAASRDAWDAKKIREEEESYEASSSCEAYDRESHYFEDITVQF
eukprot:CAMPEP_0113452270 /NCGR_PEP_ID=MMETSP0014_2-20120614/6761_1 /TAXON_ID=2857 /ORGANISM="Nitzschia sp." /LENGTH=353 /DNA_ID=CAMNT_0000343639 /DNA_START=61 /DNA_END=1122 /DNA_ORIENTATION=+ /assembly_acc=CAM_ASM_000159